MPSVSPGTADAIELAETLQLIAGWLAADHERLAASLLGYIGHPAYGPDALRAGLDRFAFLLGGNDGEHLTGRPPRNPCRHRTGTGAACTDIPQGPAQPAPRACLMHGSAALVSGDREDEPGGWLANRPASPPLACHT
jgi:hypothetical protein